MDKRYENYINKIGQYLKPNFEIVAGYSTVKNYIETAKYEYLNSLNEDEKEFFYATLEGDINQSNYIIKEHKLKPENNVEKIQFFRYQYDKKLSKEKSILQKEFNKKLQKIETLLRKEYHNKINNL